MNVTVRVWLVSVRVSVTVRVSLLWLVSDNSLVFGWQFSVVFGI